MIKRRIIAVISIVMISIFALVGTAFADTIVPALPGINFGLEMTDDPNDVAASIQLLLLLTVLSIAPAILVLMTSFTRIVIVLSFTRNAMATNQMPPNQVIVGLALFLTFFVMTPVFTDVNNNVFSLI